MAITRQQLEEIFIESVAKEFADIPMDGSSINHTFSDKYVKNMEKLVRNQRSLAWNMFNTAKKRVAVIAIAFVVLMTALCSVEEVRASLLRWCMEVYEGFHIFSFEGETTKKIENEYQITKVPEGFKLTGEMDDTTYRIYIYQNKDKDNITFSQHTTDEYQTNLDNENGKEYTRVIRDAEMRIYEVSKWNYVSVSWVENGYFMMVRCQGYNDVENIIEIVESIEEI